MQFNRYECRYVRTYVQLYTLTLPTRMYVRLNPLVAVYIQYAIQMMTCSMIYQFTHSSPQHILYSVQTNTP